jgi:hypothetical protein
MSDLAWLIDQVTPPAKPAAAKASKPADPSPITYVATRRKSKPQHE